MFDYDKAAQYWYDKMPAERYLPLDEHYARVKEFIKSHNTLALATALNNETHITPLEYFYYKGFFYIFTEGGEKFKYLKENTTVSFTIYDSYKANAVKSFVADGFADVIDEESEEYAEIFKQKGLNLEHLKAQGVGLHLLKLTPTSYNYLDSSLKQEGYNIMQGSLWCV